VALLPRPNSSGTLPTTLGVLVLSSSISAGLLSAVDAAKWLAISLKSLYNLRTAGRLPTVRLGKSIRFDIADLQRLVDAAKENRDATAA
jgi:excisionase family DNA binding protein